jgi:3-deoxy-D-manno-octulosonate 8-phosphate phosphatase (KDO 8-P phosphatase)
MDESIIELASSVKLLLMDCDGVLTDGKLYYTENGDEIKAFNVRDGHGLVMWHAAGFRSGIISGRSSVLLERRALELGVEFLHQKSTDKIMDFEQILSYTHLTEKEVAFIGDDLPDIPLMKRVGFPVAVNDAAPEAKIAAKYITKARGGEGAIREVTDLILNVKVIS